MNIEIQTREDCICVTTWQHRNHPTLMLFTLGTSFEFNGSTEFIARLEGKVIKPYAILSDD
jgi:hypothetical protein